MVRRDHFWWGTKFCMTDPRNMLTVLVMELASVFDHDPSKLWIEFRSYRSFVSTLQVSNIQEAIHEMWKPAVCEEMLTCLAFLLTL